MILARGGYYLTLPYCIVTKALHLLLIHSWASRPTAEAATDRYCARAAWGRSVGGRGRGGAGVAAEVWIA
eukprot:6205986-Pleurochrysis_carterae.AAC.5